MRQDERNNQRDSDRERLSGRHADQQVEGAWSSSYSDARDQRRAEMSRHDRGHDDGWGDNREGYDNAGRFGVRGSSHEGRGGYTQDRAEEGLGGYSQSWAEFGFQGSGWGDAALDDGRLANDVRSPWGGEDLPGFQVREGASGRLDTWATPERSRPSPSHAGRGPKGYRRSDSRITDDVCEMLTRHPRIDAGDIEVQVKDGEVTLTGTVDSREAKRAAEDAAEQCSGVDNVINQLRVNREAQVTASDRHRRGEATR